MRMTPPAANLAVAEHLPYGRISQSREDPCSSAHIRTHPTLTVRSGPSELACHRLIHSPPSGRQLRCRHLHPDAPEILGGVAGEVGLRHPRFGLMLATQRSDADARADAGRTAFPAEGQTGDGLDQTFGDLDRMSSLRCCATAQTRRCPDAPGCRARALRASAAGCYGHGRGRAGRGYPAPDRRPARACPRSPAAAPRPARSPRDASGRAWRTLPTAPRWPGGYATDHAGGPPGESRFVAFGGGGSGKAREQRVYAGVALRIDCRLARETSP